MDVSLLNYKKDYPFYVTDETLKVAPLTFSLENGIAERESVEYFFSFVEFTQRNLNRKCIILDIGAQTGLYSLYGKFLSNSHILAFEPFPMNFKCLEDNIKLNNISNVSVHKFALGDNDAVQKLSLGTHNGEHTLGTISVLWKPTGFIDVVVRRLDTLLQGDYPLDFMKIDTEGYEYFILKGSELLIKKWKPQIFLEVNPSNMKQCGLEVSTLENYLTSLHYKKINEINGENHHYIYFPSS